MIRFAFYSLSIFIVAFSSFAIANTPTPIQLPGDATAIQPIDGEVYMTSEMCPTGTWSNTQKLANVFECSPCEDGHVCEIPGPHRRPE